ncbi:type II secretion system protein [Pelomonas cellulosilytica]|uniref:Type II secretion system protein n=1 Tax=Pelomonas cellulosilytica TaxID=2906762 RepID=A0ABS8XTQ4_9BURK|nr:type II secretion system protein [Pelomonas sp. P8]MCE4554277.1 type II secretion system protein [Pelomonas sp. P8]
MLLLVALMAVGLTRVVDVQSQAVRRDKEAELLFIGMQFSQALDSYSRGGPVADRREYPATLDDLLVDRRGGGLRRHLRKRFTDPMTGNDQWGLVMAGGRIVAVHSLSEQRPLKQDHFEPAQAGLASKSRYAEWLFGRDPAALTAEPGQLVHPPQVSASQPERAASSMF